jgi:hypothetical protein
LLSKLKCKYFLVCDYSSSRVVYLPSDVLASSVRRLASRTSTNQDTENVPMNDLYKGHCRALESAGLPVPKSYPSLQEALDEIEERRIKELNVEDEELARKKAKKARDQERATFFCVGFSRIWDEPLHKELKRLHNEHNLKWLQTAMSYHKFSNLGKKFNSDLSGKIMKGVVDQEWSDQACNCNSKTLLDDGNCLY